MSDLMGEVVPADLELRPDVGQDEVLAELTRHSNQVLFGRDERGDERGELTAFRAVVIVGGVMALTPIGVRPMAIAVLNGDGGDRAEETYPKIAERLREIASDLERMVSGS